MYILTCLHRPFCQLQPMLLAIFGMVQTDFMQELVLCVLH